MKLKTISSFRLAMLSYSILFALVGLHVAAMVTLNGCGSGSPLGYGNVGTPSSPDEAGVRRPNYIPPNDPTNIRWNIPVVSFRVKDDRTGAIDRASRMAASNWNAGFILAASGAPIRLTPAAKGEVEGITIHCAGWRKIKDGTLSANTELYYSDQNHFVINHADVFLDPFTPITNLTFLSNVLEHEFGHSLGFRTEATDRKNIMFPDARNWGSITTEDMNTFLTKYALPPGSAIPAP